MKMLSFYRNEGEFSNDHEDQDDFEEYNDIEEEYEFATEELPHIPQYVRPIQFEQQTTKDKVHLTYEQIMSIINDIFLCNYLEKRQGKANLVNLEQIIKWSNYFEDIKFGNIPHINVYRYDHDRYDNYKIKSNSVYNYLNNKYPLIYEILLVGNGKLSLCGGSIIDIIRDYSYIKDFDFFFHCDSIEEADDILNRCLLLIDKYDAKYTRSQGVLTAHLGEDQDKLQFIRRIYKTKDQILLGFDMAGCRVGYNPIDGVFATMCGGLAIAMKAFPVDVTQRSFSFIHRLRKYYHKGFDIMFPGIPLDFNKNITTCDGKIEYNGDQKYSFSWDIQHYDSDYEDDGYANWHLITKERYHNVTFLCDNLDELLNLPDTVVEKSIIRGAIAKSPSKIQRQAAVTVVNFMGPKYLEYITLKYINNDKVGSDKLWKERFQYYIEKAKECVKLFKDNPWKYKDPGSQSFGKFSPIMEDPRKWYGDIYESVEVGLNMDRFQAWMDCRKNIDYINNLPNELFKCICNYWLIAETRDAYDRLFSYVLTS